MIGQLPAPLCELSAALVEEDEAFVLEAEFMSALIRSGIGIGIFDIKHIRFLHLLPEMAAEIAAAVFIGQQVENKVIHDIMIYINIVNVKVKIKAAGRPEFPGARPVLPPDAGFTNREEPP